ncbi:MAG: cytochrome c family protein [Hyphomicrobiaceae bacterium]
MRKVSHFGLIALVGAFAGPARLAHAVDNPKRGGEVYRACAACHSLEPGVHLTGPSLAGLWGKKAGTLEDFVRYSKALKAADLVWDENTLNAWLAHPEKLVPDNYMIFRGIMDNKPRSDLIAFLKQALAPGGAKSVVEKGLINKETAMGQRPEPLRDAGSDQQVTSIRHCHGTYFVTTADGKERPYWEMNVRFKTDTASTGPKPSHPVIVGAGMMGDRVSIVFADPAEIAATVKSQC